MTAEYPELGEALRQYRQDRGLTQVELAREASISQSRISKAEAGHKTSRATIKAATEALGLDAAATDHLLLAGGYAPESALDFRKPALRMVAMVLDDPILSGAVQPLCEQIIEDFAKGWLDYSRAKQAQYRRQWNESIKLGTRARQRLDNCSALIQAYVLDTLGSGQVHVGELAKAEEVYNQIDGLVTWSDDKFIRGMVYAHRADLHRSQSRWREALEWYERASREFSDIENKEKVAWIRRKMGLVHLFQGEWYKARALIESSLDVFREVNDRYELAKTHMVLGWIHSLRGDWDGTLRVREEALRIAKDYKVLGKYPDQYLIMQGHLYYGYDCVIFGVHDPTGDLLDLAEQNLNAADQISSDLQEKKERGMILLGLARLAAAKGRHHWEEAEEYFDRALREHNTRGDRLRAAVTLFHWASLQLKKRNTQQALELLRDARTRFLDLDNRYYREATAVLLCEAYLLLGHPDSSFELAGEQIRELEKQVHPFTQHLIRFKVIQGSISVEWGRYPLAARSYGDAIFYAVRLNRYLCREVARQIARDIKNSILYSRGPERAAEFCRDLVQAFQTTQGEQERRGLILSQEQQLQAQELVAWLTDRVPRDILTHRPITEFV